MSQQKLEKVRSPKVFYILLVAIFSLFGWRLFSLQVIHHDKYKQLALDEHLKKFEIAPTRGDIYLKDGDSDVAIVLNEVRPTLFADPTGIKSPDKIAGLLVGMVGGEHEKFAELLALEDTSYVILKKKLTAAQAQEIKDADLAGIGLQDVPYRVYPEGGLAAQILGFVNNEGLGQYGVEAALQEDLGGESGLLKTITDVNGIPLASAGDSIEKPAIEGKDVVLTIDRSVQSAVEKLLEDGVKRSKAQTGSAIVMNPNTGAVVAMANYPSYKPAQYTKVEDYSVFTNDVVSAAYESGSGVKVFTMSTGLNEGVVSKDSTYYDAGYVQIDDRRIENAGSGGGINRTMLQVIQNSVNTGVVHVVKQLGGGAINRKARDTLYDYFTNKFGFGTPTGIAQSNEAAGYLISPKETEGNAVRYANMAFGQGMTITMLQMVAAFSSVVNGGDYYKPYLVDSLDGQKSEPQIIRKSVINKTTSDAMLEMTQAVVANGGGWSAQREGYFIGGKTGTSQVLQDDGTYSDTREIGSFTGYTGGDRAEFVIMTRVDEPGIPGYAGSIAAAPIFADISNWLIDHYQIAPGN